MNNSIIVFFYIPLKLNFEHRLGLGQAGWTTDVSSHDDCADAWALASKRRRIAPGGDGPSIYLYCVIGSAYSSGVIM